MLPDMTLCPTGRRAMCGAPAPPTSAFVIKRASLVGAPAVVAKLLTAQPPTRELLAIGSDAPLAAAHAKAPCRKGKKGKKDKKVAPPPAPVPVQRVMSAPPPTRCASSQQWMRVYERRETPCPRFHAEALS